MAKNLYDENEAAKFGDDQLALRVYTSRLLGADDTLVMHGGGNTSVKMAVRNIFGEDEEILYIKGSGWDLGTIEKAGFSPVKLQTAQRLAKLPELSDSDMVNYLKAAMTNPNAPTPSIEAIPHAILPHKFIDHTHADAVVTVTNTPNGRDKIREIYGEQVLILPYVMPGFLLAKCFLDAIKGIDLSRIDGMVLMHHGIFSFGDTAKQSYDRMIELVNLAERYIEANSKPTSLGQKEGAPDTLKLSQLRKNISNAKGSAQIVRGDFSPFYASFSELSNAKELINRGTLTPDHIIRTKRTGVFLKEDFAAEIALYQAEYDRYFDENTDGSLTKLNSAPNYAVLKGSGVLGFGAGLKDADVVLDIARHTASCIHKAEGMGGFVALSAKELFLIEYWELEQAKLKKGGQSPEFTGKIAFVTGAASGIGKAIAEMLHARGAAVVGVDINPETPKILCKKGLTGIVCDATSEEQLKGAIEATVKMFGGLDILVLNAGIFPPSANIEEQDEALWQKSLELNLNSHQKALKLAIPYLKNGIDASVIFIASRNVPAPGPGAGAYSVAKAAMTQLARVAALELAPFGVRVNTLHPHAVFDTGIWSDEVLAKRAAAYNLTVEQYKKNNLLKCEITSKDVAELVCAVAGKPFAKTTGAQLPIDGGNDRVI